MARNSRKVSKTVVPFNGDSKIKILTGVEPIVDQLSYKDSSYNADLQVLFAWYHANRTRSDAAKYLAAYAKKEMPEILAKVQSLSDRQISLAYAWSARAALNGAELAPDFQARLSGWLATVKSEVSSETEKPKKKVDIQAAMREKSREYLGDLEGALDDVLIDGKILDIPLWMTERNIPAAYMQYIADWAKGKLAEYLDVYKTTEKDVKEGYSNISKAKLAALMQFLKLVIESTASYAVKVAASKVRKPRAKKVKSVSDQIKGIKYLKSSTKFKATSIHPAEIVGASQLWVFNEKTRKVGVYHATDRAGLQVKGTTLQNFDEATSVTKTCRKPDEVIKRVLDAGKVALRKVMDEVTAVEGKLTGRLNDDIILLRAIK